MSPSIESESLGCVWISFMSSEPRDKVVADCSWRKLFSGERTCGEQETPLLYVGVYFSGILDSSEALESLVSTIGV